MKKDLNRCEFIGRLGQDPEFRQNATNSACNFSIACSDDYKKADGSEVNQTNWINIVTFGKLAEICNNFLKKGSQIWLEGKFVTRKWQDNNGVDRYTTEIQCNNFQFVGDKPQQNNQQNSGGYQRPQANAPQAQAHGQPQTQTQARPLPAAQGMDDFDDDIPF